MSLRTVVEVALHFESFRNVDLFHQGLYHLKTRLYRKDDEQRLLAVPYAYFTCPSQADQLKAKPTRTDHHHLIPAHIIEDQCTFSTRSFLIRYCEEEVELNDIGQFRIELSPEEAAEETPLLLEVDLMFADLTQHGGADRFGEQPDVDSTEFKSVSTQQFRVHRYASGLHEFCPVVFDEFHFCFANLAVHSAVVDFRLRLRPLAPVPARPKAPKAGEKEEAQGPEPGAREGAAQSAPATQNGALSLTECFFGNGAAVARAEDLLVATEALYAKHFGILARSHAKLEAWLRVVGARCLTPAQREAFGDLISAQPLRLPHGLPLAYFLADDPASGGGSLPSAAGPGGLSVANGHAGSIRSILAARLGAEGGLREQSVAMHMAYDMDVVSCQILEMWHRVLNVMSYSCREITALLRATWERQIVGQWASSISKETIGGDIAVPDDKAIWEAHNRISESLRLQARPRSLDSLAVEDLSLAPKTELHPILFEQRFVPEGAAGPSAPDPCIPSAPKQYRGVHLFVLVHGFQGNSFDMRLMKNNIALLYPDAIFLCSNSNEDNTEGDMNEMGIRLAQEVVNYICDWCPGSALGRLSFIAHSIGGLITRAALPLLHEYSSKMFTLLTFSTPHLGYFQNNISLFQTGFWVLKKWRKSTCLEQLAMTDATDQKETFLYRLSKTKGFEFFQNIILVSSYQDQYAPFESARVEMNSTWDTQAQDHYGSMVRNLWEPVRPERLYRLDVNFNIPEKNLDAFIGRAAHIQFLECQPIMKMIVHNYSSMFR